MVWGKRFKNAAIGLIIGTYLTLFSTNAQSLKKKEIQKQNITLYSNNKSNPNIASNPSVASNSLETIVEPELKPVIKSVKCPSGVWKIKREWNKLEVDRYSDWVQNIWEKKNYGTNKQKGAKLHQIIRDSEMNKFLQKGYDDKQNPIVSNAVIRALIPTKSKAGKTYCLVHCGSFPKLMLLYYSYKRGLPFFSSYVRGKGGDVRYSRNNQPVKLTDNISFNGTVVNFIRNTLASCNPTNFTTGNYRTAPKLENTDSVPIKINPQHLIPGTIAYNTGGHAFLIGKVNESGEVFFLDAHPDGSISYSKELSVITNVSPIKNENHCYGGFRALRFAKIKKDNLGRMIGVEPMSNKDMEQFGYSTEQYEMMQNIKLKVAKIKDSKISSFHEYIIKSIKNNNIKEKPFKYIREAAIRLDDMFETRKIFVDSAWQDVLANGSIKFPNDDKTFNIYQADGKYIRWEVWSSPSSDVDRKCAVIYVGKRLESMINSFQKATDSIDLEGRKIETPEQLAIELLKTYKQEFNNQSMTYTTSKNKKVRLTLYEITDMLWDLSFDPNHPPELRWGNKEAKNYVKRSTLFNGFTLSPKDSYKAEEGLRFIMQRQDEPTSMRGNPTKPLEKLPQEILKKYFSIKQCSKP